MSTNEISRREAPPRLEKFVGLGTARAARAAGFEVAATHPTEQARLARIGCPTRRARGNSSYFPSVARVEPGRQRRLA